MESLAHVFRNLGVVRLVTIGGVLLAVTGFFVVILTRISSNELSLLYADLDPSDSAQIVRQLESDGIPFELRHDGGAIYVPKDQVARTRVTLADEGLPSGGSIGYELFDTTDTLGVTNFVQNVNLVRALEGELARTIRSIDGVQSARVHLVLSKRELFSRESQDPSASIVVAMRGNGQLAASQVAAIRQLVASAVPRLSPSRVSVVDGNGTLLAGGAEDGEGGTGLLSNHEDQRARYEVHLARTIERVLEKTVGSGRVRAEVTADMDFDRINTSEEVFDPDGQVVRSSQTILEETASREGTSEPPVGVAPNLPDADLALPDEQSAETSENRTEETVNYEISKRVVNHVREVGTVKRLSVAVLVDGVYGTDAEGATAYEPRTKDELNLLAALVRGAIGFNAERGDTVEVINMRFASDVRPVDDDLQLILGLEKSDLLKLAQYLVLCVFALLIILLVVRPLLSRTLEALPVPATGPMGDLLTGSQDAPALTGPGSPEFAGGGESAGETEELEEMIDLDRVEGRVRASTIKKVGEIVSKHPDEAIAIIRNWLHDEQ